jgi:putative transposase
MSLWRLYYHFVWSTHGRLPLITVAREEALYQFMRHKTDELGARLRAIGGVADHVHLIVSVPPTLAIAQYVHRLKGSSSRYMNVNYPDRDFPFKWQQDYGVFSISEKNLPIALNYVNHQKQHHNYSQNNHAQNNHSQNNHSQLISHLEPDHLFGRPKL